VDKAPKCGCQTVHTACPLMDDRRRSISPVYISTPNREIRELSRRFALIRFDGVKMPGGSDTKLIEKSLHRLGLSLNDYANPTILKILNVPKKGKLFR